MPKELKGIDATHIRILRLILKEPGSSPDFPLMGIGIRSKFRFIDERHLGDIEDEIKNQMSQYLPECLGTRIGLKLVNKVLYIGISANDVTYEYSFNGKHLRTVTLNEMKGD